MSGDQFSSDVLHDLLHYVEFKKCSYPFVRDNWAISDIIIHWILWYLYLVICLTYEILEEKCWPLILFFILHI
jgi:hypothetical protein